RPLRGPPARTGPARGRRLRLAGRRGSPAHLPGLVPRHRQAAGGLRVVPPPALPYGRRRPGVAAPRRVPDALAGPRVRARADRRRRRPAHPGGRPRPDPHPHFTQRSMSMPRTALVTGATGTVSTALIEELAGTGVRLRALVRAEARAEALRRRGVEAVVGDLGDARSLPPAFEGVQDVWLLVPNGPRAPENNMNAVWAARRAGVQRIVRLSAVGAAHDAPTRSGRLHALSDRETEASGLRWTILRPLWFMQNLLNEAGEVAAAGTLSLNMASARLGMVDARDVAACAARVLLDAPDRHHGAAYTLSGPRRVSLAGGADHPGRARGRPVAYRPVDDGAKRAALLGHGVPEWIADMLEEYARAYASGWGDFTTGAVAGLLGRPPRDIADFARDHAAAFAPAAGA